MNLVLLPHHNTIASLQKLQQSETDRMAALQNGTVFLPSFPLVCVLASSVEEDGDVRLKALKDMMKGAEGRISFGQPRAVPPGGNNEAGNRQQLIVPVNVPFMDKLSAAGFTPDTEPYIILGSWYPDGTGSILQEAPVPFRAFQLALMQTTPLTSAGTLPGKNKLAEAKPPAAFSWKFSNAFWVKLD